MSNDNDQLKPLSFDDDDFLKPLSFDDDDFTHPLTENNQNTQTPAMDSSSKADEALKPLSFDVRQENQTPKSDKKNNTGADGFVPILKAGGSEIKHKDSNFVFFFGTAESGKSAILATMLYYMRAKAGDVRPRVGTPNTKDAEVMLYDYFENIRQGKLPMSTHRDQVTRLDLVFEPNNKSKKVPPINLTFLEMSGENHNEIRRGGQLHSSIESFLTSNLPLVFILVTSFDKAHQDDVLINTFLDKLESYQKNLKSIHLILVVSKWDKSGQTFIKDEAILDEFISTRLPMTSTRLDNYGLVKTFYTVGELDPIEDDKVTSLSLDTAATLSNWLYESVVGYPLNYEGTFWERLKFNFTN